MEMGLAGNVGWIFGFIDTLRRIAKPAVLSVQHFVSVATQAETRAVASVPDFGYTSRYGSCFCL